MSATPVVAANAPVAGPTGELSMLQQGYSPQTVAAAQHSQYLAQALQAMSQQGQNIRTPVALGADLLASALLQRKYGQSMQDLTAAAQGDRGRFADSLIGGLTADGSAQAGAAPSAPADASTPAPAASSPAPAAAPTFAPSGPSPIVLRAVLGEAGADPEGQKAVYASILKRAQESGLTPEQVVTAPGQYEGLNAPWMGKVKDLSPYLARTAANISGTQAGPYDSFYSPSGQAALNRPAPAWAQGPGADIGGNRFYQVGYHAPAGMTPAGVTTGPRSTNTPSPSPGAASPALGGTASPPPAAASPAAGGASLPPMPGTLYAPVTQGMIDQAIAKTRNPMTYQEGIAELQALRQRKVTPIEPKAEDAPGGQMLYDPYERYAPQYRATPGLPMKREDLMTMGPNGPQPITAPLSADKAFSLQDQRLKSEGYQNWANSKEAFDAMKENAVQPGGMSGYALLDTFARTINPAGAVRLGTIKAIEEMQGLPEDIKGMLANIGGQGKISPQLAQQIINAALPFVKANYARAQREQAQAVGLAKAQGIDPRAVTLDLGEAPTPLDMSAAGRPSIYDTNASPVPHPAPHPAPGGGQPRVLTYDPASGTLR